MSLADQSDNADVVGTKACTPMIPRMTHTNKLFEKAQAKKMHGVFKFKI